MGIKKGEGKSRPLVRGVCFVSEGASGRRPRLEQKARNGDRVRESEYQTNQPPPFFCQHTTRVIMKKYAILALNYSVKERQSNSERVEHYAMRSGYLNEAYNTVNRMLLVSHRFVPWTT